MHELSIAVGIVELAKREVEKAGGGSIESIEIVIGELSGIVLESLEFIWPIAVENTILMNSKKIWIIVKGEAKCIDCSTLFPIQNQFDICPNCNSIFKEITKGKELKIKAITINN